MLSVLTFFLTLVYHLVHPSWETPPLDRTPCPILLTRTYGGPVSEGLNECSPASLWDLGRNPHLGQLCPRLSSPAPHLCLCFCLQSADSSKQPSTLAGQFKKSLDQLMKILTSCQPYFIRCIKPNEYKKPLVMRGGWAHAWRGRGHLLDDSHGI